MKATGSKILPVLNNSIDIHNLKCYLILKTLNRVKFSDNLYDELFTAQHSN